MYDNLRHLLDFDDLLFRTRNKEYGAYQLRKRYNSVVITGIIIACLTVSLAVAIPFILTSRNGHVMRGSYNYLQVHIENLDPPMEEIILPPAPPPPDATHVQEIAEYVPPVVVDSVPLNEKQPATTDEILSQTTHDKVDAKAAGSGDDLFSGTDGSETDEPFYLVEVMPAFRGGDINKFREWVQKRTNYPQVAIDNKIKGRVFLTFIIEPDGSVSNVTVVKGVDPLIDNEAVKAIQTSPKWTPGLQRGQPVKVRYSMWLSFIY